MCVIPPYVNVSFCNTIRMLDITMILQWTIVHCKARNYVICGCCAVFRKYCVVDVLIVKWLLFVRLVAVTCQKLANDCGGDLVK